MGQYETKGALIVPKLIKTYNYEHFECQVNLQCFFPAPKTILALLTEKVPTFRFYLAILHMMHKNINCGTKYANLTQKLFKTSLQ